MAHQNTTVGSFLPPNQGFSVTVPEDVGEAQCGRKGVGLDRTGPQSGGVWRSIGIHQSFIESGVGWFLP